MNSDAGGVGQPAATMPVELETQSGLASNTVGTQRNAGPLSLDALLVVLLVLVRGRVDTFANAIVQRPEDVVRRIPLFGGLLGEDAFDLLNDSLADPLSQLILAVTFGLVCLYLLVDVLKGWPRRSVFPAESEARAQDSGKSQVTLRGAEVGASHDSPLPSVSTIAELQQSDSAQSGGSTAEGRGEPRGKADGALRAKLVILVAICVASVLGNTGIVMALRQLTTPSQYAHDGGVLEGDLAIRYLLEGKNVYQQDWRGTWVGEAYPNGPGLTHYPYLPFAFLPGVPIYFASTALWGWYDHRLLYIAGYLLLLLATPFLARNATAKLALLGILALNPILANDMIYGFNDMFVLAILVVAAALMPSRPAIGAVVLGLAAATKGTVWPLLPFVALYFWRGQRLRPSWALARPLVPLVLTAAIVVAPFALWDFRALFEDTVLYNGGSQVADGLPIKGWGAANFAVALGLVDDLMAPYPFWIWELVLAVPLGVLLLVRQWRMNSLPAAFTHYGIVLFVFLYLSRTMNPNYLGFCLSLLAIGYFGSMKDDRAVCR